MKTVAALRPVLLVLVGVLCLIGCRASAQSDLPVYGDVPAFSLTDQAGQPFTREAMRGKVWIAGFMFTRCPTICPALMRAKKAVQASVRDKGGAAHVVSFSVDPDNDTPPVLSAYAAKHGADLAHWSLVTGDDAAMRRTAEEGFKLAVSGKADPKKEHFGLTHGSHLVLVDPELKIRGYYRSSEPEALERLAEDAARLSK